MYTQREASISRRDCRQIICQRLKSINWGLYVAKREKRKREKVRKHRIIFKDEYEKRFLCVVYIINSPKRREEKKKKCRKSVHYDLSSRALSVRQKLVHLYVFTIRMCVREACPCLLLRLPLNPHQPFAFTCFGPIRHLPPSHVDILFIESIFFVFRNFFYTFFGDFLRLRTTVKCKAFDAL